MRHHMRRRTLGQSVVELALVLLMFVALFAGILDVGRVYMTYQAVQAGVREGARFGITGRSIAGYDREGSIKQTVKDFSKQNLQDSEIALS